MSLLAATWVGAAATVALFAGALVTAFYAVKAFRKQWEEVRLLQQQAERDLEQRRRDQAAHVFVWADQRPFSSPEDLRPAACLRNGSEQPVYDIRLGWGDSGQSSKGVLMPGEEHIVPGAGTVIAEGKVPVWAEFRDAVGARWRATSAGELTELR